MCKPTSITHLAALLFVDSRWHEPHDAVQCRARGSTFEFSFEFQTEFFSNCLFEFQVVRESNRSTIEGSLYIFPSFQGGDILHNNYMNFITKILFVFSISI